MSSPPTTAREGEEEDAAADRYRSRFFSPFFDVVVDVVAIAVVAIAVVTVDTVFVGVSVVGGGDPTLPAPASTVSVVVVITGL